MKRKNFFLLLLILFSCSSLLFGKDTGKKGAKPGTDYETQILLNYGVTFSANGFLNGFQVNSETLGGITVKATLIRGYMFGAFFQMGYFLPTGKAVIVGEASPANTTFSNEIRSGGEISFGATYRFLAEPLALYVGLGPHIAFTLLNLDTYINGGIILFTRCSFNLSDKFRVNIGADISYNFLGTTTSSAVEGKFIHNFTGTFTTGWSYSF